jgi:hypothetical protein
VSALADELHSVLSAFRNEVATWTNSGLTLTIDGHLRQIEAAAADIGRSADDEVHRILTDLYTAVHAPAQAPPAPPANPAPAPVADVPAAPPADPAPAEQPPATGGTVSGPGPVVIGESGPDLVLPQASVAAAPAAEPAPVAAAEEPAAQDPAVSL